MVKNRMADYRRDYTAPLHSHIRGRMGAGDHPLAHGQLAHALGLRGYIERADRTLKNAEDLLAKTKLTQQRRKSREKVLRGSEKDMGPDKEIARASRTK